MLVMFVISISTTSFVLQSCDKDLSIADNYGQQKYLDLEIANKVLYTQTEKEIIVEAFQRIVDNILYDENNFLLTLSAKEMNMSEQLLNYLYNGLGINPDFVFDAIPVIKTRSESYVTTGIGFSQVSVALSRSETLSLMNTLQTVQTIGEFENGLIASGITGGLGTIVASYYVLKNTLTDSDMYKFAQSNSNGSTFVVTNVSVPGTPYFSTSGNFFY